MNAFAHGPGPRRRTSAADATGGISGIVTAAAGGARLSGVNVDVFFDDNTGSEAGSATTGADGTYQVTGLDPAGYLVCFDGSDAAGGSSRTGYLGQCYKNMPWANYENPSPGTTPVQVTAGKVTTAIDGAIGIAGGISGTVTAAAGGARLSGVNVVTYDGYGDQTGLATTGANGTYQVTGLPSAAPGYSVCFYAPDGSRYASQCYRGVPLPWDPPTDGPPETPAPAPGSAPVPVTAGRLTTAVDAALDALGGISGTVTAAAGGARLSGVNVEVFTSSGDEGESVFTGADGTYRVTDLPAATPGYIICFDTTYAAGGSSRPGYPSQCYRNVPWEQGSSSPAPGATPVPVTAGKLTTLNLALVDAGGISGTVTAAAGGAKLSNVYVHVYTSSGADAGYATTGADGTYQVTGLPPAGYYVCFDASGATGGGSVFGYPSQCYRDAPWELGSGLPPGATRVQVTAGRLSTAVNAGLNDAGGISGTVTAAAGGAKLSGADVEVFTSSGHVAGSATGTDGTYQVTGLPAASGYVVCFDASDATGGSSPLGYASQCYRNVPWAGGASPPPGAAPVPVTAGKLTPAVNAALNDAGGISGTVTAAAGGTGLSNVSVEVFNGSGGDAGFVFTGTDGTYQVTGLDPGGPGYRVCFDATTATSGSFTPGYLSQCYRNVPWAGGSSPASGATPVPVTTGKLTSVDAALGTAGGISGTVTAAAGGAGLSGADVEVFTAAGDLAGSAATEADGTYVVTGLPPVTPGYRVCIDARPETGGGSSTGYASQCCRNTPWDFGAPAAGATPVPVTAGRLTPVNAVLGPAGGISGTVTAASGGATLSGVNVEVYNSGGDFAGSAATGADGSYQVTGLTPATPGYLVCFDPSYAAGGNSRHGYHGQCFRNVPWNLGAPAAGATAVPVTAGRLTPAINAALA